MLTITVTANYLFWFGIPVLLFLYGKLMQQGGIKYARGENWQIETLMALAVVFTLLLPLLFVLIDQNTMEVTPRLEEQSE